MPKKKLKRIIKHLFYVFFLSIIMLFGVFYAVLPRITNHSKTVQVPDLTGIHLDALEPFLTKHRLCYVVTDNSGYSANLPPFTVLQQFPAAGASVKENRKIYLTLNAENPPLVGMPNLIEVSIRQAQLLLKNKGLKIGNMKYVPDITKYTVLEQWYNGKPIPAGRSISKGSSVDLVIGAGLGTQIIEVPDVLGMPLEEASLILLERGMRMGLTSTVKNKTAAIGSVVRQNPTAGTKVRLGVAVNLYVASM
ncbi:PASTA domain-containing protein [Cardinium endosymbiont of Tipula unca]|uniref:PASTA domain-containing protein n=1 Tax=Cardinium endosymbiont of Tipula unca TaxID=3066216 RepID=UPI0030CE19FE